MLPRCSVALLTKKMWADYLFKNGSMIGPNERLLGMYVEWIANRRMKALVSNPSTNPC